MASLNTYQEGKVVPEQEILPWDRQASEPEKAYGYFVLYRDLGRTRTVARVAGEVNKSRGYMHNLASGRRWVQRAQAWDREQDRVYGEGLAERRRAMADRHARIAGAVLNKVVARLQSLEPDRLSAADLVRWLEVATRLERLALGLPDSATAHTGADGGPIQAEVSGMSEQQRAEFFRALIAEAQARAGQHDTGGVGPPVDDGVPGDERDLEVDGDQPAPA